MKAEQEFAGARIFARMARELAMQTDLQATGDRLVNLAQTLMGCDEVELWSINRQGGVRLHSATDPTRAEQWAELAPAASEGIGWACLQTQTTMVIDDVRQDDRWPAYRQFALAGERPMLSSAAFSLTLQPRAGALVLSSAQASYFTAELVDLGLIFADHAAVSVEAATAGEKAQNLELALSSNRRIGIALGVIMISAGCTDAAAFDKLRSSSQSTHRKLRDVAEEVIFTGTLPEPAARLSA